MTTAVDEFTLPILSVECNEPEGKVVRTISRMPMSIENLQRFWNESRKFRTLFSQEVNANFNEFLNLFLVAGPDGIPVSMNGLFWVVDDFIGIFYMTEIKPGFDALVHYTFFDRRQRGRHNLVREMLSYVFEHYGFRRLSVEIPMYAVKQTFIFVEELGFKKEGRKRKAAYFDHEWFDVTQYGILREEVLNG